MKNCVMPVSALLLCAGLGADLIAGEPIPENDLPPVAVWPADLEYDPSLVDLSEPETPEWVERLRNSRGEPNCELVGDPDEFDYVVRLTTWPGLVPNRIVYIDASAPLGGDGSSWSNAYQSLHDALNAEDFDSELIDIRVAQGLYRADRVNGVDTLDPDLTYGLPGITVTEGVPTGVMRIAGGFAGRSAKNPDARDLGLYPTVFTGDLLGNDTDQHENYEDNTKVMFEPGLTELNGIEIEHGRIAVHEGRWITDCAVRWCSAAGEDLPVVSQERAPVLAKDARVVGVTAHNNQGDRRGGAVSVGGFTLIGNSRFMSNASSGGGAIMSVNNSTRIVIQNGYFASNRSIAINGGVGGAVYNLSGSPDRTQIIHSTFVGNESIDGYSGAASGNGSVSSYNSIYNQNYSAYGGDIESNLSLFRIQNNSNQAAVLASVFSIYNENLDTITFTNGNRFELNIESDQPLLAPAGFDGVLGTIDDDPSLASGSAAIGRSVFPAEFPQSGNAGIGLYDIGDLDGDCDRTEPLPIDLLGNPRAFESVLGEGVDGYAADAGCIEFIPTGKPQQPEPWVYVDPQITDFSDKPIRLYVNAAADQGGDGFSWQSALQNPGEALAIAASRVGPVEIWVTQGSYVPPVTRSEIRAFRMQSNVTMLGGFIGNETEADQRDWQANQTVLTGDVLGNDQPGRSASWDDNAKQVVISVGARGGGILDGFTISSGSPRQTAFGPGLVYISGAGLGGENEAGFVYIGSGDLSLSNCRMGPDPLGTMKGRPFVSMDGSNSNMRIESTRIEIDRDLTGVISDFYPISLNRESQLYPRSGQGDLWLIGSEVHSGSSGRIASLNFGSNLRVINCRMTTRYSGSPVSVGLFRSTNSSRMVVRQSVLSGPVVGFIANGSRADEPITIESSTSLTEGFLLFLSPGSTRTCRVLNSVIASSNGASNFFVPLENSVVHGNVFAANMPQLSQLDSTNTTFDFVNNAAAFFADPLGPDGIPFTGDEDLRLAPGSPAINTGLNAFVDSDFDLDGNPRIIGSVVDRGAYEFTGTCTGDVNGDGQVNLGDLNLVLANFGQTVPFGDASGDGTVDLADLNLVLASFGNACTDRAHK